METIATWSVLFILAYCILRNETKQNETERNEPAYLRVRYAVKDHFFRNETHYSAVLAGQGNAKEN